MTPLQLPCVALTAGTVQPAMERLLTPGVSGDHWNTTTASELHIQASPLCVGSGTEVGIYSATPAKLVDSLQECNVMALPCCSSAAVLLRSQA